MVLTITLPDRFGAFIDAQVAAGVCGSPSEYIGRLVRAAAEAVETERLRALIEEGLATEASPLDDAFLDGLRTQAAARVAVARGSA